MGSSAWRWSRAGRRDYLERISSGQTAAIRSGDLAQMMRLALRKETDGAYSNVVVATFYLDNIRARPGALVFDPSLPHSCGSFLLSSQTQPQLIEQFDRFLQAHRQQLDELKAKDAVEANLDSEYLGLEQWKVDYLKRQKDKAGNSVER